MFDLEAAFKEFSRFNSYVTDVRREIQLYEQIYCSEESNLLRKAKLSDVFGIIQKSMFISVLTRVSALFDSKSFGEDKNLSVAHLAFTYQPYESEDVGLMRADLTKQYKALGIKGFRNKLIAHNDLATVLGSNTVSHNIKPGDLMKLMNDARQYAIALTRCIPGGMDAVLQVKRWELKDGQDGHELLRVAVTDYRA